jgi:hypothetical protein
MHYTKIEAKRLLKFISDAALFVIHGHGMWLYHNIEQISSSLLPV